MKINRRFLDEIAKRLDIVSAAGRSTIEQIMINAPQGFNFDELYEYVSNNYLPIAETCSSDAAVVGASAYDTYRELEVGETINAMPFPSYNAENTAVAVGEFVTEACDKKDMSLLVDYLGRRISTEVMRSYTNTHLQNGATDNASPRFARVPSGPNPCAFCRALAGNGFIYKSRESAGGNFNRFHDDCKCQVVPEFSAEARKLEVQGYDPEVYAKEWRENPVRFNKSKQQQHVKMTATGRPSTAMPKIDKPILTETPKSAKLPDKAYGGEWNQKDDMEKFLKTMFNDDEYVGTCAEFYTAKDGRRAPTRGLYQRNARQIENVLDNTNNVSAAVGRYRISDGAYVRINPLDGKGISDANVVDFRYALIECDTLPLEQQYGFVKALNLPTQAIVTSGKKSIHAVVRVDASDIIQYKERVALLQAECKAAGFDIDASTKNPSRFMRIPGVKRGDGRQVLVSTGEGANSWDDWREWCNSARL